MIKPTIGRVIWFYPQGAHKDSQPYAAFITYVHGDMMINVGGFDHNGVPFGSTSVLLHSDPESYGNPGGGAWAKWMPYQVGQAAKTEQVIRDSVNVGA